MSTTKAKKSEARGHGPRARVDHSAQFPGRTRAERRAASKAAREAAKAGPTGNKGGPGVAGAPRVTAPASPGLTTGTGAGPMISENDPRQQAAVARQPVGLRPSAANESTADRAKGLSQIKALLYRGLEILRVATGHVKSPDYLVLEKDLGFGPKVAGEKKAAGSKKKRH